MKHLDGFAIGAADGDIGTVKDRHIVLFGWMTPVPRRTARLYREDPLAILQRRYAAGEITTAEYEERKAHIQKDLGHPMP